MPSDDIPGTVERAKRGDAAATVALVESALAFILRQAQLWARHGHEVEDMVQAGIVGFLRALRTYDHARRNHDAPYRNALNGYTFGAVVQSIREHRRVLDQAKCRDVRMSWRPALIPLPELTNLMSMEDDTICARDRARWGDKLAEQADSHVFAEARCEVQSLLRVLRRKERDVICRRYGIGCAELPTREIGRRHGVTRQRVSQIEHEALAKMAAVR